MDIVPHAGNSVTIENGSAMVNITLPPESGVNHVVMVVYNVYLCLVMMLGLPGNTLVLVVFAKHKPSTTTDWFILFITLCDFVTLFINVPVYITLSTGLWPLYGNTALCVVHMFVSQSVALSSSFLICGLALDRYIRICRPMMFYSTRRARNICITISIVTTVLSLPCLSLFENRQGSCRVIFKIELIIYYTMVFLTFVAAIVIVAFSYIKVNTRIKETEAAIARHNTSRMTLQNIKGSRICLTNKRNQVAPSCKNSIANKEHIVNTLVQFNGDKEIPEGGFPTTEPSTSNSGRSPNQVAPVSDKQPVSNYPTVSIQLPPIIPACNGYRQASKVTTKLSFLVCVVFITSWVPPWTAFIFYCNGRTFGFEVKLFARMTHLVNTASNPILYAWLNRKFRKHMKDILCCFKG